MMKWSLNLGKYAGIKVQMHWTFLLLIAWVIMTDLATGKDGSMIFWSVAFILAVFACIVLHEFGHALAAKRYHINTHDITLLPIGGVARLERIPDERRQELFIAIAGPAVNVVIAALLYLVTTLTDAVLIPEIESMRAVHPGNFLQMLLNVNIFLVVFNLIPAFPMDGGRIFRALLSFKLNRVKATKIASFLGQLIAIAFAFLGLFGNPFLIIIAIFVYLGAQYEAQMVQSKSLLEGYRVKDVMMSQVPLLKTSDTLNSAVQKLLSGQETEFLVTDNSHVDGLVTKKDIIEGLAKKGKDVPVSEVMNKTFKSLNPEQQMNEVYNNMHANGDTLMPVVDNDGKLLGAVNMENIMEFVMVHSAMELHETSEK